MKAFPLGLTKRITLTHGDFSIEVDLRPLPLGYSELLAEILPAPKGPINGKPSDKETSLHSSRQAMLLVAKTAGESLGLEAVAPKGSNGGEWAAYADAVRKELEAANFLDGDLQAIVNGMAMVNRGIGDLPKT